jgi:hypothetical protein
VPEPFVREQCGERLGGTGMVQWVISFRVELGHEGNEVRNVVR